MLRPAIASVSLGRSQAGHGLIPKIEQAARHGFKGIEMFFECLEDLANKRIVHSGDVSREERLLEAAHDVRLTCDRLGMKIVVLQPFLFYDGLVSSEAHQEKIEELRLWFKLCHLLGTDLIQIPSNFLAKGTTGDLNCITQDLRGAAELAHTQSPPIRLAYEGISWGTHVDTWESTWDIVQRVNRPNFGLCLDTFHIAGRVWADPETPSGVNAHGDEALKQSLRRLVTTVDPARIFYVQIGDAERVQPPLNDHHPLYIEGQKPRMIWSRNARLFPFEIDKGAYLPVTRIIDAIFAELGWQGWVSMEVFSQELYSPRSKIPQEYAQRGQRSWKEFCRHLQRPSQNIDVSARI